MAGLGLAEGGGGRMAVGGRMFGRVGCVRDALRATAHGGGRAAGGRCGALPRIR
jgi:hypothetical protein